MKTLGVPGPYPCYVTSHRRTDLSRTGWLPLILENYDRKVVLVFPFASQINATNDLYNARRVF